MTGAAHLLDTGTVVDLLRDRSSLVRDRLRRERGLGVAIGVSSLVVFELWYGVAKSGRPRENAERLRLFLAGAIEVIPFAAENAAVSGQVCAELASLGTPIGPYDVLIVGQALRRGVTLVTTNGGEFSRVEGLRWEDWSQPA